MKKTLLFFCFVGYCFTISSQNTICVDGNSSGSQNGSASNPYSTIQAAITAASNGDIIKVAKGTYSEALQISQKKVQLLGGFSGNGNFTSANPQANTTIIKGTKSAPCISVYSDKKISGTLIISGFTIRDGLRGIKLSDEWPGGFLDNITIENNIIENNGTKEKVEYGLQRGGGISLEGNNVTIQNNVFRNNLSGRGAAIGTTGSNDRPPLNFLITDNRFENNKGYDDHAGGVWVNGTGTITRNVFDGNVIDADGTFGYGYGGAILVTNYDTTRVVALSYNVYLNNYAPLHGGAVFVDEAAKVRMEHELFYNNKSKAKGSAVYVDADYNKKPSVLYMDNCTVSGNSTGVAGGPALYVQGSIAHVQNSIFWNNGNDFEFDADGVAIAKLTVNYTLSQKTVTGTGNISVDPLFADATTFDFHLKSKNGRYNPTTGLFVNDAVHSPAIDAGNPASNFSNEPNPNGGRVNMGCYGNTAEASKSTITGIDEIRQTSLTIFPNPTTGELRIENGEWRIENVEIFDIMGKKVLSPIHSPIRRGVSEGRGEVDISGLPAGIYFLKVAGKTVKVIKQ